MSLHALEEDQEYINLQTELVRLQQYIKETNKRVIILFEGRDTAGKGGAIMRFIRFLNPRLFRVVALSKPTEREAGQWYFQRYINQLPMKGEVVFFDRSWYNRAVVEPVFGFCSPEQHERFMQQVNPLEHLLIDDGIILLKFFLNISKEEQKKRLEERKKDPMKQYKIGGLDEQAQEKWEDYTHYFNKMLQETSTGKSPWIEIKTDDKKQARLETMKYILQTVSDFKSDLNLKTDPDVVKVYQNA